MKYIEPLLPKFDIYYESFIFGNILLFHLQLKNLQLINVYKVMKKITKN